MTMGKLEFTTPRNAWGGEATDFTPLLGQDDLLAYLGDELGIGGLRLIEREHSTAGNRSLDLLAETMAGDRVSIENQYGMADHDHLTRGLAYAVASESRILVVIAEGHRDEFISVANYLNELALQDVENSVLVWLVEVRAVRRVGDDIWSPEFIVRAEPNEWQAKVAKSVSPNLQSLDDFYAKCETSEIAERARRIIEHWLEKPDALEGHNAQRVVALYHRSPHRPKKGTNVLQLGLDGSVTVARGYIRDSSGLFEEGAPTETLDERIRKLMPDTQWPEKGYYINGTAEADAVIEFLDWIAELFTVPQSRPNL